ncbi:hypothetical protein JCM11251_004515 [Rhodosporidiobolus azoricus]
MGDWLINESASTLVGTRPEGCLVRLLLPTTSSILQQLVQGSTPEDGKSTVLVSQATNYNGTIYVECWPVVRLDPFPLNGPVAGDPPSLLPPGTRLSSILVPLYRLEDEMKPLPTTTRHQDWTGRHPLNGQVFVKDAKGSRGAILERVFVLLRTFKFAVERTDLIDIFRYRLEGMHAIQRYAILVKLGKGVDQFFADSEALSALRHGKCKKVEVPSGLSSEISMTHGPAKTSMGGSGTSGADQGSMQGEIFGRLSTAKGRNFKL